MSLIHPSIPLSFFSCAHAIWKFPWQGSNRSYSCDLCCSYTRSLTHCAELGIELAQSKRQARSLTHCATAGALLSHLLKENKNVIYTCRLFALGISSCFSSKSFEIITRLRHCLSCLPRDVQLGTSCTNHRRLWGWLESSFMAKQSSGTWKQTESNIFQTGQWNQTLTDHPHLLMT